MQESFNRLAEGIRSKTSGIKNFLLSKTTIVIGEESLYALLSSLKSFTGSCRRDLAEEVLQAISSRAAKFDFLQELHLGSSYFTITAQFTILVGQ